MFLFLVQVVVVTNVRDGPWVIVPPSCSAFNAYRHTTLHRPEREVPKSGQASGRENPRIFANENDAARNVQGDSNLKYVWVKMAFAI